MAFSCKTGFTYENPIGGPDEWYTPYEIFEALKVDFDMDVCSPGVNVVPWIPAERHITRKEDGLIVAWSGRVWLNPPYGKSTGTWLNRMTEYGNGIALVMSRTDTQWFHKTIAHADAVCFIRGRLSFIKPEIAEAYAKGLAEPKGNCGAGSVLMAFGEHNIEPVMKCGLGWSIDNRDRRQIGSQQHSRTLFGESA